jgi:hypothetical protein
VLTSVVRDIKGGRHSFFAQEAVSLQISFVDGVCHLHIESPCGDKTAFHLLVFDVFFDCLEIDLFESCNLCCCVDTVSVGKLSYGFVRVGLAMTACVDISSRNESLSIMDDTNHFCQSHQSKVPVLQEQVLMAHCLLLSLASV